MWTVRSVWFSVVVAAAAQVAEPQTPKEQYEALVKAYKSAEQAWTERYQPGGKPTPEDEYMVRHRDWPTWSFLPRFMEFADQNSKDAAAVDALLWIVDQGQAIGLNDQDYYPFLVRALEHLERRQILDNRPFPRPRWVMRHPSSATERFLRNIMASNKNRDLRGRACLYLGELQISRANLARNPWFDREPKKPMETYLALRIHPAVLQYIRATDVQAAAVEGELLLERAKSEFGDINWDGQAAAKGRPVPGHTIGEMAQRELDEIRRPPDGKATAP